jgi:hypothetical protein
MFALLCAQDPTEAALTYMRTHAAADAALVAGRLDEARTAFERCSAFDAESATIAYALACVAARSGDLDRAFTALKDARKLGFRDAALAEWDTDLESLRGDLRWAGWLSRTRAETEPTGFPSFPWIAEHAVTESDRRQGAWTTAANVSVAARSVIVGDTLGNLERLSLTDGTTVCAYQSVDGPVWRIATHPSKAEFAVLTGRGQLAFFRCDDTAPFATGFAFPRTERAAKFPFLCYLEYSPDGSRIAFRDDFHRANVWSSVGNRNHPTSVWSADGSQLFSLGPPESDGWYVDLAWTADGAAIARREQHELVLYDSMRGDELFRLATPSKILCARFDLTGDRFATGHEDATLRLWDAHTFTEIGEAHVPGAVFDAERDVNTVTFTLDGSRVAYAACESVGLGVIDAADGRIVMEPGQTDGHWCEPVGLLVDRDASNVWYSPGCGGRVDGASIDHAARIPPLRGSTPRANETGLVAFACDEGIACFDVERRVIRWARPLRTSEVLLQAGSGHFGVVPRTLASLSVERSHPAKGPDPLVAHSVSLFDPKRVRASLAGVELECWR